MARRSCWRRCERGGGRSVTVNHAEPPLSWLRARGLIDALAYVAGRDCAPITNVPRSSQGKDALERRARHIDRRRRPPTTQINARRQFDRALDNVGRGLSDIFGRVMCAGEPLPTAERALGWPTRSGRLLLTLALDRLADAYGLPRDLNR